MKNNDFYICYASSDFYARETGISLLSLLDNNRDVDIKEILLLDYGITEPNKENLRGIAAEFGLCINFIDANPILDKIGKESGIPSFRGSYATYSRAFIDSLVPEYVGRMLYVDSDTVCIGSVKELRDMDIDGVCIAAKTLISNFTDKENSNLLSGNKSYFQMGVILYNMENFRSFNCRRYIFETAPKLSEFKFADQTLINNALPEFFFKKMPQKYNFSHTHFNKNWVAKRMARDGIVSFEEAQECVSNPVILHFPGRPMNRPWYDKCISRFKDYYLKYRAQSPWKDDSFFSLDEYKASLKTINQKFGYWVTVKEMTCNSWFEIQLIWKVRASVSNILSIIKKVLGR